MKDVLNDDALEGLKFFSRVWECKTGDHVFIVVLLFNVADFYKLQKIKNVFLTFRSYIRSEFYVQVFIGQNKVMVSQATPILLTISGFRKDGLGFLQGKLDD